MAGLVRYDLQQAQGSVITPHEEYTEQKTNPWLGVLQGASGLLSSGLNYAASKEAADAKSLAPLNEGIQKLVTARDQGVEPSQLMKMEKDIIPALANTYTPSQIQAQMDLYGYQSLSKKSGAETTEGLDAQRVIQKNIGESILGPDATSEAKQKAGQDALANLARTEQAMSEIQEGRTQEEKNEAADLNLRYMYRDAYNTTASILNRQNYSLESYTAAKQLWVQNMQTKTGLDVNSLNAIFERGTATLNSAVSNQEKTVEERKKAVETANELTESLAYQKFLQQPVTYRDPVTDKVLTTTGDKMMAFSHKIPLENLKVLMGTPEGREVVSAMFAPGKVTTDVVPSLYLKSAEVGNILSNTDKETADRIDNGFKEGLDRIIEEAADTPKEDLMEQGSLVTPAKFNEIYGNLTSEQLQQSPEYADVLADRDNLRNKLLGATVTALSKITDGRSVLVDEDGNFRLFESDGAGFKDVTDLKDSWFNFGARGRAKAFDGTAAELRKMFFNLKKFGYSGKEISDMFNKMSAISSEEFKNVKVRRQASEGNTEALDRVLTIEEAQQYADEALGKKTQRSKWIDEAEAQRIRQSVAEELPGVDTEYLEDVPEDTVITTDTADFVTNTEDLDAGIIEEGNIDLDNRPVVNNEDGTISTIRSITIEEDGNFVLIPTVVDGKIVSDDAAIAEYERTGQHLGKYTTEEAANAAAETLSEEMGRKYSTGETNERSVYDIVKDALKDLVGIKSAEAKTTSRTTYTESTANKGKHRIVNLSDKDIKKTATAYLKNYKSNGKIFPRKNVFEDNVLSDTERKALETTKKIENSYEKGMIQINGKKYYKAYKDNTGAKHYAIGPGIDLQTSSIRPYIRAVGLDPERIIKSGKYYSEDFINLISEAIAIDNILTCKQSLINEKVSQERINNMSKDEIGMLVDSSYNMSVFKSIKDDFVKYLKATKEEDKRELAEKMINSFPKSVKSHVKRMDHWKELLNIKK